MTERSTLPPAPDEVASARDNTRAGTGERRRHPRRIDGIDLARGIAILGMLGAHTLDERFDAHLLGWDPSTWLAAVHGRSSILFATLLGISIALLSGGAHPHKGARLRATRQQLLLRAACLFAIGWFLIEFNSIWVIIHMYGLLVAGSVFFLTWSARRLCATAVIPALTGGLLCLWLPHGYDTTPEYGSFLKYVSTLEGEALQKMPALLQSVSTTEGEASLGWDAFNGTYPLPFWMAFLLLGMAVGRLDLASLAVRWRLTTVGAAMAIAGYVGGLVSTRLYEDGYGHELLDLLLKAAPEGGNGWELIGASPHSGTVFEAVGSSGVALVIVGLCLLAPEVIQRVLFPVRAAGTMALTLYAMHALALYFIPEHVRGLHVYAWFAAAGLVFAVVWRAWRTQGPLEHLLARISRHKFV
ncbi:heparan-alpha-glucosaminide N-acetyltransferase domain-containing protein [Streptomyces sp. NPDC005808]|uniref:heparan-alpha-glucosaminide N-acetyltransferase domain-containing protein n=1 Tax=Streptomyces sp. NPDC005808 TaxID=3364734 RepID=UPI00367A7F8A